jgi:hypothetical protein
MRNYTESSNNERGSVGVFDVGCKGVMVVISSEREVREQEYCRAKS